MASVSMAMSVTTAKLPTSDAFIKPLPVVIRPSSKKVSGSNNKSHLRIEASLKEKAMAGLTAAAISASMVVPEVAQAASNDFSPSLKNFLLSIAAGGVVLTAILGAVIGVSNFDPVKRS
ncbi:OLC1v1031948C1 [Oldenlandia corymbosa var. corymbosa]|uniref:OLC1v1031948C1 n=1 Tax=Oldenlandia corymbosa var. corymbosa TaxID=529605 RepID=A0AAV1CKL7_OLDCO|nr:OLC1v1031948C1 [Oldenlandia corymbosa var. corymbosa]